MIFFLAAVAAIAGLLFGYDEGVIAVASPSLEHDIPMTTLAHGFTTAAVPLGALLSATVAGRITDRFGRRSVLMMAAALFAVGAVGASMVGSIEWLVVARLVLGAAIGVAAVVAPLYIAESAPLRVRGALVSTYQLAITAGIVLSYLTGLVLGGEGTWRVMFAIGAVPGLVFLLGLVFLPESPRWLVRTGQDDRAAASLTRLRGAGADISSEISGIKNVAAAEAPGSRGAARLLDPWIRPALVVGTVLFFLQQLSGINAVIYYAPTIFRYAGLGDESTRVMATVGVGVVNFVVTIFAMMLIDQWGRRPLLIAGFAGTACSLLLIGIAAMMPGVFPSSVVVLALFAYIASFAISVGPLPHLMMSEVFPLSVRGPGMSVSSVSNWGFNFVVVFLFPVMLGAIGLSWTFALFAAVCIGGMFFTAFYLPETKGVSLEEIESHLRSGQKLADLRPAPSGAMAASASTVRPL
jgi:MFS transporter, SP family, galactose:H+ symporter